MTRYESESVIIVCRHCDAS